MSPRCTRSSALLAALALAFGVLVAAVAPSAGAYPTADVLFEGRGWGHGRGLGQYGSYGYAVNHGWGYGQILDHFYGGTTKGARADGLIDVRLQALDGTTTAPTDMTVTSGAPFVIGFNTYAAGEWGRVRWNGTGWTIERAAACEGPWTEAQVVTNGDIQPETAPETPSDDFTKMINLLEPAAGKPCSAWTRKAYRGTLRIARLDKTFTRVLNRVAMEQYLRGVVPSESPASWGSAGGGKGINALKAQAVAARSYAWAENRSPHYKTCDTTTCQVYNGAAQNGLSVEQPNTDRAIAETAGEVRVRGAATVHTEFSSSTGGVTAGGSFPVVADEGDATSNNPNHRWKNGDRASVASIEAKFPTIGELRSIVVTERTGQGEWGGWVKKVRITGSKGSVERTGEQARTDFGLLSAYFQVIDVAIDVTRLQGPNRDGTAAAVSADQFGDGTAAAAVLVSSTNYPDALVGVPLAVARSAPILLTGADRASDATMAELQRATGGGKPVYVLGGTAAVGTAVEDQLRAAGYTVTRYGGASRYATAVQVAEALGNPTTILQATGTGFADALAAGAAAGKAGGAVLLTNGNVQAPETAAYLQGKAVTRYAVGGAAAAADPSATKLAGVDRYETAIHVADRFFPGPALAGLASGVNFPDALSGGVHADRKGGPLVLTASSTLPLVTKRYLHARSDDGTLTKVYVYGGTAAVADAVVTDLKKR